MKRLHQPNRLNKFYVIILLLLMVCNPAKAYDACVDGIYYNVNPNDKSADVTYAIDIDKDEIGSYYGIINIPSTINYMGVVYNVISIGKRTFYNCSKVTGINIPESITYIGEEAFRGASSLKSLSIPNSVITIGDYCFYDCSGLESITLPSDLTYIPKKMFNHCYSLASLVIPNGVTSIEEQAMRYCESLTTIVIPDKVTTIGGQALKSCVELTSVTIGKSVSYMGHYIFRDCCNLKDVYCYAEEIETIEEGIFMNVDLSNATLHVLSQSVNWYKEAEQWKEFGNIVALTNNDPQPTRIKEIPNEDNRVNHYYDLNGRLIEKPQKGLYIFNGKKMLAK